MIRDGQRIAVAAIAKFELSFEIGAPQIIGYGALRRAPGGAARRRA